jgi:hypothetical protein
MREIGSYRLSRDIQVGSSPAIVSAFLESVQRDNIQLRVNNVQSSDGSTTFALNRAIGGDPLYVREPDLVHRGRWLVL